MKHGIDGRPRAPYLGDSGKIGFQRCGRRRPGYSEIFLSHQKPMLDWRVIDDCVGSDYQYIAYRVTREQPIRRTPTSPDPQLDVTKL